MALCSHPPPLLSGGTVTGDSNCTSQGSLEEQDKEHVHNNQKKDY